MTAAAFAILVLFMKKFILCLLTSFLTLAGFAQKDPFVGFYQGEIVGAKGYPLGNFPDLFAEIYKGPNGYRLKLISQIMARAEPHTIVDALSAENGEIALKDAGNFKLNGKITPQKIDADLTYNGKPAKISLKRMNIVPPTLGKKPPVGAIVLFDGKDLSAFERVHGEGPAHWEIKDGAMVVTGGGKDKNGKNLSGTLRTKQAFDAVRLHLEFKIPAEYDVAHPQGRGNSGVIFGPYEVQVLDSFGAPGNWDECGSIYRMHPPYVNASLEPEAWQTYDIEYHPAKFDGDTLVEFPRFTVYLNGVLVQKDTPAYSCTSIGPRNFAKFKHPRNGVQLNLQDHTNKVAYRNIWVQPL